jgi:hypothetical protein
MGFKVNDLVRMKKSYTPSTLSEIQTYTLFKDDVGIVKEVSKYGGTRKIKWLRINMTVPFHINNEMNQWIQKL